MTDEIDRLNDQHKILSKVFDGRLIFPPIVEPKKILDCGYGSASWAVEVAEEYPDCEVNEALPIWLKILSHCR
ncbi:hypothetical protein GP486_000701 [Trichoglossum hirsutum]|uniref:S-adenosylmethionine-dependent methyltransferase n=1 Tax=Trichoglossum hirsutum TaxID=265104 RepID=A0A9P8LIF6_9PEZI|nr:hypothetical protein GP486_000701 [Trichoglossum hirsutum]